MISLLSLAGLSPVAALLGSSFLGRDRHQGMKSGSTDNPNKFDAWILRPRALALFSGAALSVGFMGSMQAQVPESATSVTFRSNPTLVASAQQTDSLVADSRSAYSSSLDSTVPATAALMTDANGATQPPPRPRYGRPRYSDNQHNADGSSKYTFVVGGGMAIPTGTTHLDLKPSFNVQGGFGRNFNQKFSVIAQFDWANFGIQNNTLNTLLSTYNSIGAVDQNGNALTQLGGSSHAWSLTLNPTYKIIQGDTKGVYVIAGAGYYHKTANFTIPGTGTYCDPYYGCYQYQANQSIDKYTSNAFGVNGGIGFTYKLSRFSAGRLYVEARYVFIANQPRPYSLGSAKSSYFDVFPQNSARTTFIPVTVGVRF